MMRHFVEKKKQTNYCQQFHVINVPEPYRKISRNSVDL